MISNKIVFFLASFVVFLAFAFVVPCALAGDFATEISVEDVSFADSSFPQYQHDNQVERSPDAIVYVKFDKIVAHANGPGVGQDPEDFDESFKDSGVFTYHDVVVQIYNEHGAVFDTKSGMDDVSGMSIEPRYPSEHDGQNFKITFDARTNRLNADEQNRAEDYTRVFVYIKPGGVTASDPAVAAADSKNAGASVAFDLVYSDGRTAAADGYEYPNAENLNIVHFYQPEVYEISTIDLIPYAGVTKPFKVKIRLSERARSFTTEHIDVAEGKVTEIIRLEPVSPFHIFTPLFANPSDVRYLVPTGRWVLGYGPVYYDYLVTIEPKFANTNDIVIKVKAFEDLTKPNRFALFAPHKYEPPTSEAEYVEGFDKLTVKVGKATAAVALGAGVIVDIANDKVIPEDGYLVIAKDAAVAAISVPGGAQDATPAAVDRTPAGMEYNVIAGALPNLETFLGNGGTIDLVSPDAGVVISEVMWGSDASDVDSFKSQWIEIQNTSGKELKTGADKWDLIFYGANETLPDKSVAANNVQDRVGTIGAGGYWSLAGKGQSGRSGVDESVGDLVAVVPTQALISMQRAIDATGVAADGTAASSWAASSPPGLNFDPNKEGVRIGSPGAAPVAYPVAPVVVVTPPAPVVSVATAADIMISEIMVDTGGNRLPQWIELSNVSGKAVSLAGWSVLISNSAADADVVGASVSINLSGTLGVSAHTGNTGKGQSLLLVAWGARSSSQINADLVMNVSSQVGETGRYTLISEMGFMIALVPPQETGVLEYGDMAGNLDEGWELPTADGARSSFIRREMDTAGMATMGTMANGWVLASDTALVSGPATWYGSDEDAGTPGYDAGGPLPVELSHFRPARNKETGAVVITWSTQSELNNAGFFIKRSQQRDGEFKVINATMVAGAGTTSEKQFYTYEDTTAQPNVVYYYQIEDVSLDGNRQTLTRGIRLKGHVGAAGKATTTWGDLKTQE